MGWEERSRRPVITEEGTRVFYGSWRQGGWRWGRRGPFQVLHSSDPLASGVHWPRVGGSLPHLIKWTSDSPTKNGLSLITVLCLTSEVLCGGKGWVWR